MPGQTLARRGALLARRPEREKRKPRVSATPWTIKEETASKKKDDHSKHRPSIKIFELSSIEYFDGITTGYPEA